MDGVVYLITGLAGAGKTTLGNKLFDYIKLEKKNVVFWDGDILRDVFDEEYDHKYDRESRQKASMRDAKIITMLSKQGIDVVVSVIAMFDCFRESLRKEAGAYYEIFLDCDMDTLKKRDKNGLYSKALNNEITDVVGIDIVPELPNHPDLRIKNDGEMDSEQVFEIVINAIRQKIIAR